MLGFYMILTVVFTFPLIFHFRSEIPKSGSDVYQGLSTIHTQVETARSMGGAGLWYLAKQSGTFLWFSLASLALGPVAGYNLVFLLTYFVSAVGMYFLAFHFTRHRIGSLVAGAIFAFAPFHVYESTAVHFGVIQQQWLPWLILFFARFLEKRKLEDYFLFALFFLLVALTEHQMLAFTLLFLLVFFGIRCFQDRRLLVNRKLWVYFLVSAVLLGSLAFTVFGSLLQVATSDSNFLDPGMGAAEKYSMPFFAPLVPPAFSFFKSRVEYFLGFALLATVIWLIRNTWKKRQSSRDMETRRADRPIWLWFWLFVAFWVLALGPTMDIGSVTVYLPYFLAYKFLPFYENIRVTGRLFLFTILSFSMLVGYAILRLETISHRSVRQRQRMLAAIILVTLLEFWVAPLALMPIEYSPFYDKIAQESGDFKLLEIPGSTDYGFASYKMFTASIHHKQSLDGMPLARKIKDQFKMQNSTPVIKQLLFSIPKGTDVVANPPEDAIAQTYFDQATDILNFYGVRYITLNKNYTEPETFANEEKFIQKYVCNDNRYEDSFLVAYRVCAKTPSLVYLQFNNDNNQWSPDVKDKKTDLVYRAMGDGAVLEIRNLSPRMKSAKLSIRFSTTVARKISVEDSTGHSLPEHTLDPAQPPEIITVTVPADKGTTTLTFSVKDPDGKSVTVKDKKNSTQAPLVSGMTVEVVE
ncbi:MAG: hypothetical protein WCG84_00800 [Candidatus Moraniibacteriota bacterium]